jgi:hypothetical protein
VRVNAIRPNIYQGDVDLSDSFIIDSKVVPDVAPRWKNAGFWEFEVNVSLIDLY